MIGIPGGARRGCVRGPATHGSDFDVRAGVVDNRDTVGVFDVAPFGGVADPAVVCKIGLSAGLVARGYLLLALPLTIAVQDCLIRSDGVDYTEQSARSPDRSRSQEGASLPCADGTKGSTPWG